MPNKTNKVTAYRIDHTGVGATSGHRLLASDPYGSLENEPAEHELVKVEIDLPDWLTSYEAKMGDLEITPVNKNDVCGWVYYPDKNVILVNMGSPNKDYAIKVSEGEVVYPVS